MSSMTCFDDLPDLVLIEMLSYLSSIDVLWGLTDLNYRLTMLINERGFFHHINLSSARFHQFQKVLRLLPVNEIQSLVFDTYASPLQLSRWPYLPRLTTLRIIDVWDFDELSLFIQRHAATLTHLIVRTNERSTPEGLTLGDSYPKGEVMLLINDVLLVQLPALRSLDLDVNFYRTAWPFTSAIAPLAYIRISLWNMRTLVKLMSTSPLSNTLRHLHVILCDDYFYNSSDNHPIHTVSAIMLNLRTFTLVQTYFSILTVEWKLVEMLTSSKVMPVLRRANLALPVSIDYLDRIRSAPIFIDHRHVEVNFAFSLINCRRYNEMTQLIPCGSHFYPREIAGATFIVNSWYERSKRLDNGDPYDREHRGFYCHHMWYTLPWSFDEFFYQYIPYKWITKVYLFHLPSRSTTTTIKKSSLRTLDASGQTLTSCLMALPHVVLDDCIETLHLSFYNRTIDINLPNLRNLTLVNSINCLNYCSRFPPTICSVRILLFHRLPNYMLPNWPLISHSLSTMLQLTSLRIFMYDLLKTIDDHSCQMIAKAVPSLTIFSFCFRHEYSTIGDDKLLPMAFHDHVKFIKELCRYILLFSGGRDAHHVIEDEGCGLMVWS